MMPNSISSTYSDTLSSLAILRVQSDNGQDYLQNFVPFLAECIRKCSSNTVTLPEIKALFMSTFGLNVPQGVIRILLERAVTAGYVRKTNKVYQRRDENVANLTIEHDRTKAKRELDALLQKFTDFVERELRHTVSIEDGEQILYEFIRKYGSDALVPSRHSHDTENSDSYLAGEFIRYLEAKDPVGFDYLVAAVQGSMMSSMLHYEDQNKIKEPWHNMSIYLDTPFILRTLDLYGSVIQRPYIELVETLIAQGVNVRCFSRTLEEIQGVLSSIKARLQNGQKVLQSFEELGEELLATNYKPVDVQLLSAGLEKRLNTVGIQVVDEPPHLPHLVLDQLKAEAVFQARLNYKRESAKEHDVAAVLSMHRLRLGRHPQQIERSVALFVTTNSRVVQAADQVMREQTHRVSGEISWCMQHDALVTLLFLKNPVTLTSLPRKQIVADAMAALKPTPALWQLYLSEIDNLRAKGEVIEEQITYLRCDPEALSALTRLTLNDSDTYAEGTVEQVLKSSRAAITRELEADVVKEQEAKVELQSALDKKSELLLEEQRRLAQKEQEVSGLSGEVSTLSGKVDAGERQNIHLKGKIDLISKIVTYIVFYGVLLTFGWVTWSYRLKNYFPIHFTTATEFWRTTSTQWLSLLPFGILAFLAISPLFGKARDFANWVSGKVSGWLTKFLFVS